MMLSAIILSSLIEIGMSNQHYNEGLPNCDIPYTIFVNNTHVPSYVNNCSCVYSNGSEGHFKNDTPCYVLAVGYEDEYAHRPGKCQNGICIADSLPYGCADTPPPKIEGGPVQLGCTYTCHNNKTGEVEFGYLLEDTPCWHYNNETTINTTCKKSGKKTVCRENVEDARGC
uniref:Putative tick 18.3 kDa family protein n=1 Tax=Rhipicephalus pulchellus TaxID=72859 RepID=L7MC15_RHIPC